VQIYVQLSVFLKKVLRNRENKPIYRLRQIVAFSTQTEVFTAEVV